MDDFIRFAISEGFTSYGISSHAPLPFSTAWTMEWDRMEDYLSEFSRLKKKYAGKIELAIGLAGLDDLGDKALARQLGVAVDQLVEVGQDALGRVALDGQILGQEHVGDDAGHDLGVQLGDAGEVVLLRGVL